MDPTARRRFVRVKQAWYAAPALVGDLYAREEFGLTVNNGEGDGDLAGEMYVRWLEVGGEQVPRLEAFDDSWHLLPHFSDVLAQLGDPSSRTSLTPDEFQRRLLELGFVDATKREPPRDVAQAVEARKMAGWRR